MVFSSLIFIFCFLPLVLLGYFLAPRNLRNTVLLVSGLVFYLWGAGEVVLVLLVSIAGSWGCGAWALRAAERNRPVEKAWAIGLGAALNLGILFFYKYAAFLISQFFAGLHWIVPSLALPSVPEILLPIGVSFFTFQSLSYILDVAWGRVTVRPGPVEFAMYIAMFPQLVAGPIVRYGDIKDQLSDRPTTWENFCLGAVRFSYGLAKKVLIADTVAVITDQAFGVTTTPGPALAWLGLLSFTLQVYFDFSGYSDMALGLGRMFGFRLPENFNRPFAAVSVTDFWRRWHITLSSWFRDYVYIPLGGSRTTSLRTYRNLLIVFLLVGFWHGANWTFLCFGLYHGLWMVWERIRHRRLPEDFQHPLAHRALTFLVVMLGMVWFRARTLPHALGYFQALAAAAGPGDGLPEIPRLNWLCLAVGSLAVFLPGRICFGRWLEEARSGWAAPARLALLTVGFGLSVMFLISNDFKSFIYFQF